MELQKSNHKETHFTFKAVENLLEVKGENNIRWAREGDARTRFFFYAYATVSHARNIIFIPSRQVETQSTGYREP